jgi:hypothetical protein
MPFEDEAIRRGWAELSVFLGLSLSKTKSLRPELKACGAVFYMVTGNRPRRKRVCWFASEIKKWLRLKGAQNEVI